METQSLYNWHVLIVRPKTEKVVGAQLSSLGFETCVPIQKQLKHWSDRKKIVETVLFHNYVFVATDLKSKNDVYRVKNIIKYLQYANKPAVLRPHEVALIKQLSGIQTKVDISYDRFSLGDYVEIISGPLYGQKGFIKAINGSDLVQLSLPSLNCFANVTLTGETIKFATM
jgi:transcription antitermination factor NusG